MSFFLLHHSLVTTMLVSKRRGGWLADIESNGEYECHRVLKEESFADSRRPVCLVHASGL